MEIYKNVKTLPDKIDGLNIYPVKFIIHNDFYGLHAIFGGEGEGMIVTRLGDIGSCSYFVNYVYEAKPYSWSDGESLDFEFELRGMGRGFMEEDGTFHYTYKPHRKLMYPTGVAFLPREGI